MKGALPLIATAFAGLFLTAGGAQATVIPPGDALRLGASESDVVLVRKKRKGKFRSYRRARIVHRHRHGRIYVRRGHRVYVLRVDPRRVERYRQRALAAAQAASRLSCEAASLIVSGYGFSEVAPTTCSGSVYEFSGLRDGAPYAIRLNSADGELAQVTKR
jgi:hypothetical protein